MNEFPNIALQLLYQDASAYFWTTSSSLTKVTRGSSMRLRLLSLFSQFLFILTTVSTDEHVTEDPSI